jgi:cyclopropane fatty-acyl-phospholipid synthase-like methyltransferase
MTRQTWPAPERNKLAITEVLRRVFPSHGQALEIASGSGQHAVHFATEFPELQLQPTDIDAENLASIAAWVREAELPNLNAPLELDVCAERWDLGRFDAIFCANMVHIAPWRCAIGLFDGAARHLEPSGTLALYGPFRIGGEHTAPSNATFDASLQERNAEWGVRDLEALVDLAEARGLALLECAPMPANNQTLVFRWRS